MHHLVRDGSCQAPRSVIGPALRQEQLAIQQAVKVIHRISQMHGDDVVVLLPRRATPPLHAGRFFPFLRTPRLVNNSNTAGTRVLAGHERFKLRLHLPVIPVEQTQELLQRPRQDALRIDDRNIAWSCAAKRDAGFEGRQ